MNTSIKIATLFALLVSIISAVSTANTRMIEKLSQPCVKKILDLTEHKVLVGMGWQIVDGGEGYAGRGDPRVRTAAIDYAHPQKSNGKVTKIVKLNCASDANGNLEILPHSLQYLELTH